MKNQSEANILNKIYKNGCNNLGVISYLYYNTMNMESQYYNYLKNRKFNTEVILLGKFIYNSQFNFLRCQNLKFIGTKNSLFDFFEKKLNKCFLKMFVYLLVSGVSLYAALKFGKSVYRYYATLTKRYFC
jgi:hypothetical protein